MKATEHSAELYKKRLGFEQMNTIASNEKSIKTAELDLDYQKKRLEFNAGKDTYENNLAIEKEADIKSLKNVKFEGQKIDVKNDLALDKMRFD